MAKLFKIKWNTKKKILEKIEVTKITDIKRLVANFTSETISHKIIE